MKALFTAALLALGATVTAGADTPTVDFDSQRGELQSWQRVPGHSVDHRGIVLNPTPTSFSADTLRRVSVARGVKPGNGCAPYADDLHRLGIVTALDGIPLDISSTTPAANPEAYTLKVRPEGITIGASADRGTFYALQTLRQLLAAADAAGTIPSVDIDDAPVISRRGVVEGFYGDPWSHAVRLSLIDYYGRNKLNTYVYGPKDDPYHSSPNWRKPYPDDQARQIAELVDACRRNRVDFVWAIHPGKDIRWDDADRQALIDKFEHMYDLGVRAFAIHFDDIEGEGARPAPQIALVNWLTDNFVKAKGDVANLIVCPTDYSRLWASPRENGPLDTYGKTLDKRVELFYTGDVVCSDLTHDTMNFFNSLVRRPGFFWWNYPVTDYCRNFLLQGPVYGLDPTMTANEIVGLVSNPMQHGEASKLALYSVADYTWNPAAYNPIDSWERALADRMPAAPAAYRTFAIHSCDTRNGYRRDESWETPMLVYPAGTPAQRAALIGEMAGINRAVASMEQSGPRELIAELRPWMTQLDRLATRCAAALSLADRADHPDNDAFWADYTRALMLPADTTAYSAHTVGSMKLQPLYENNMSAVGRHRLALLGLKPAAVSGADSTMTDADPFTGTTLATPLRIPAAALKAVIINPHCGPLTITGLDAKGRPVETLTATTPLFTLPKFSRKVKTLELSGRAPILELLN